MPARLLTESQLRDAARCRPNAVRSILNVKSFYPQIVREFGVIPESLDGTLGPNALPESTFTLLRFYAWKKAQRIAASSMDHLRQFIWAGEGIHDEESTRDTILSLTFRNTNPTRILASITCLALSLAYWFEKKFVYRFEDPIPAKILHLSLGEAISVDAVCNQLFPDIVQVSLDEICKIERRRPVESTGRRIEQCLRSM